MSLNIESGAQPITGARDRWKMLVKQVAEGQRLMSHICKYHPPQVTSGNKNENALCLCGQSLKRHHVKDKSQVEQREKLEREYNAFVEMSLADYGTLPINTRFIRCSPYWKDTYQALKDLIIAGVEESPKLIVSCFGGAQYFTMTDDLESEFIKGIGKLATTKEVWLLTTGMNSGVSKLIGQAVHRQELLNDHFSKPTLIGMTSWDILTADTLRDIQNKETGSVMALEQPFEHGWRFSLEEDQAKGLDVHHTHLLLLDIHRPNYYLDDERRSRFVQVVCKESEGEERKCHSVTLIVEGGRYTLEVILNDLKAGRPVVIVHGSGRMASLLGMLLEPTDDETKVEPDKISDKIKDHLRLFPTLGCHYVRDWDEMIVEIEQVLDPKYRQYLKVFKLQSDTNLTATIFQAVFDALPRRNLDQTASLALLKLAVSWNCVDGAHEIFELHKNSKDHIPELFEQALEEQRPAFVDYFLRRYYDPLRTSTKINNNTENRALREDILGQHSETECGKSAFILIEKLYRHINNNATGKPWQPMNSPTALDRVYKNFIGPYVKSFFYKESTSQRLGKDLRRLICISREAHPTTLDVYSHPYGYDTQKMLRDLFLWSVYAGYDGIAFVLLLQLKLRIGAALLATAIARRVSLSTGDLDARQKFGKQADAYATYATECIKLCHEYDERRACKMLLVPRPFCGDVTYMQIAIASYIAEFVTTDTFDKVLTKQWNRHLDNTVDGPMKSKGAVLFSLFTLGLLAPFLCTYCSENEFDKIQKKIQINDNTSK